MRGWGREWVNWLLEAVDLKRNYNDVAAVDGVTLRLGAGELHGLLGPNGAGKSTTMKMMAGLLEPTAGRILYGGESLADEPLAARRMFGYLADQPLMLTALTGWEYIQFVAGLYGFSPDDIERRASELADRFELTAALDKRADGYSHGMQQKLALIAQLVHKPRVLLADEPTVGLDPAGTLEIQQVLREYCAEGNAVLLSTHLLDMAQGLCDRVSIMARGRILADGPPAELVATQGQTLSDVFLRLTREARV